MNLSGSISSRVTQLRKYLNDIIFSFVLLLLTTVISFSQNTIELTEQEKLWIAEHPVLKATNEMDWAPMDFVLNGKPTGFSIDYLNLVAQKIDIKIDYVNGHTWSELIELLKRREIDIAQSITQTSNREGFLNFTSPYLDIPKVYYGKAGSDPISEISDLKGKKIGVIRDWGSSEAFKELYPDLILVSFESVKDALLGLVSGKIDVFSNRLPVTNYIISKNFITGLEVLGTDLFPEINATNYLRIASRSDWPILNQILEKGMAAISEEEFRLLSEKWRAEFYTENNLNLTSEELNWLSNNKELTVMVDPDLAPYEFIEDNGEISGISGAYLEKIAKKLSVKFVWAENKNWVAGIEMFKNDEIHVISSLVPTPERSKSLEFTESYLSSTSAIFVRKGGRIFVNMEGLTGYRIAQEKGFALTSFIERDYPNIEIVEVENVTEALKLVASGVVDAHVGDIPTVAYHIASGNFPVVVVGETPYMSDTVMGISRSFPLFASAMKKAMVAITKEERREIANKWLAIKIDESINYELILKIVGIGMFFLFVILMWAFSLRREIRRRHVIEKQLVKAQMAAESANEAKSAFLANMSHEIRTPLNAIIGFSEIMTQDLFGKISPPRYKEYLGDIESSGRHLATVINDILDLSKIEAGKWELNEEEFDLDRCIGAAFKMMETQAQAKQVRLFYSELPEHSKIELMGDEVAFKRILINLLSNAVKFTESGGIVSCNIMRTDNEGVIVKINDTGIGIPEDKIEHVLSPFGQNEDTKYVINSGAGTGLGLSIVKELVELHQGQFELKSEVGVGTEAIIKLPPIKVICSSGTENYVEDGTPKRLSV